MTDQATTAAGSVDTVPAQPPEVTAFLDEIAERRAHVDQLTAEAQAAETSFREWVVDEWAKGRAGVGAQQIADALGIARSRLYQIRDELDAERNA